MATLAKPQIEKLVRGHYKRPGLKLGLHYDKSRQQLVFVTFQPKASSVEILYSGTSRELVRINRSGLFETIFEDQKKRFSYRLAIKDSGGKKRVIHDPYSSTYPSIFQDDDIRKIQEGKHYDLYHRMGAQVRTINGVTGINFAVWAPTAKYVSVFGEFNKWHLSAHPMNLIENTGIWELFVPGVEMNVMYKYSIMTRKGKRLAKRDPFGFATQLRPKKSSVTWDLSQFKWSDQEWMEERKSQDHASSAMTTYEVHLGSWMHSGNKARPHLNYREIAKKLVTYVKKNGFTHIELMPVMEYPFDGSWGYQITGYYAPTRRFGTPADFMYFVNYCHTHGIGVILDWVPAHFPTDAHGLGNFDGTHLYEHADPRQGFHPDWKTYIFNYGRAEVRNFLVANALFWLDKYHVDGIRIDAVASMLYLDYSRQPGQWVPNRMGGKENLEAIYFLKSLNSLVARRHPGVMMIAEESTAWRDVTKSAAYKGLGFTFKWNMGWMHDALDYMKRLPKNRRYHHDKLTFMLHYAFSEKYVLPLSHDEVVHGKKSVLKKMAGTGDDKFDNLRLLYGFMYAHPGKKLLFMGCEIAQLGEWAEKREINWELLEKKEHKQIQTYVRDLNFFYRRNSVLYKNEASFRSFEWIDFSDRKNSVVSFVRKGEIDTDLMLYVFNFGPHDQADYQIGVPHPGYYKTVFSSNSLKYGGTGTGCGKGRKSEPSSEKIHGKDQLVTLKLPATSMQVFRYSRNP